MIDCNDPLSIAAIDALMISCFVAGMMTLSTIRHEKRAHLMEHKELTKWARKNGLHFQGTNGWWRFYVDTVRSSPSFGKTLKLNVNATMAECVEELQKVRAGERTKV